MWVKVIKSGQKPENFKMYQLIDISQSGISLRIHMKEEFKADDKIEILELESYIFEQPIRAQVRYVKKLEEFGVDYKVGIEFIDRGPISKV